MERPGLSMSVAQLLYCRSSTFQVSYDAVMYIITVQIPLDFPQQKPTIVLQVGLAFGALQAGGQAGTARALSCMALAS